MKKFLLIIISFLFFELGVNSQPCTRLGDETTYGTGNIWIGYAYNNRNFTNYRSYVNEGTAASPNFDQNFGGDDVNYNTTSCRVSTEGFSMRYKLTKTFASGTYSFTVGGDDGYRFSLDGGTTWAINEWNDQPYAVSTHTVALNGSYNMILEYYENSGENRVSFAVATICSGTENTGMYGTGNIWNGYLYDGTNFAAYSGMVNEGSAGSPDFDQSFGGSDVSYNTSACPVQTETFSVRYRLAKTFAAGSYLFTVGGDDGYRLSVDGGASWIINNWTLHSYTTTSYSASLSGSHNLVLEYYENTGANRDSFEMRTLSILPVTLVAFTAHEKDHAVQLNWSISSGSDPRMFEVERSINGETFSGIGNVSSPNSSVKHYSFTDQSPIRGMAYYRLKITDRSGISTYSETVNIRLAAASVNSNKISVYPTVVTGGSFLVTSSNNIRNAVITITGLHGKTMTKQSAGNINAGDAIRVNANTGSWGKGIYLVTVSGSNFEMTTGKIIVQ